MNRAKAQEVVFTAIDEMNKMRSPHRVKSWAKDRGYFDRMEDDYLPKDEELILVGKGRQVDSMEVVTLAMAIEEQLELMGCNVSLTDDKAFSQRGSSPFRTIGSVVDLVAKLAP